MAKTFKCTLCSYTSTNNGNVTSHMRTHTGEKPYNCSMCSFTCAQKGNLKRHLLIHRSEKPFKCSICSYACSQKGTLKNHMRNHTDEKRNKCDQRSNVSSRTNDLQKHVITLTGEKSYKCGYCHYAYADIPTLQNHMGIHIDSLFETENFQEADARQVEINGCCSNFTIDLYAEVDGSANESPDHEDNEEQANDETNPGVYSEDNQVTKPGKNETYDEVEYTADGHFENNNAIESAASSGTILSTKRFPNRPSFEGCLFPADEILQETSHNLIEISDKNPAGNNIANDNLPVSNLESDKEQADETNHGACSKDNQVTKSGANETYHEVEYTEDAHFNFDDGEGHDNGILKERREIRDEETCAIQ